MAIAHYSLQESQKKSIGLHLAEVVMVIDIRHQEKDSKDNLIPGSLGHNYKDTIYDALAQELKSPLGTMLGMLDLLLTTAMSLKQKEYLEVACTSGRSPMS